MSLAYKVIYHVNAQRGLHTLDRTVAQRIMAYLDTVAQLPDPRLRGKMLSSNRRGVWRYRVGDYRVLCELRDAELVVLALEIGHRRSVYDQ